jgi:hypothetical protein
VGGNTEWAGPECKCHTASATRAVALQGSSCGLGSDAPQQEPQVGRARPLSALARQEVLRARTRDQAQRGRELSQGLGGRGGQLSRHPHRSRQPRLLPWPSQGACPDPWLPVWRQEGSWGPEAGGNSSSQRPRCSSSRRDPHDDRRQAAAGSWRLPSESGGPAPVGHTERCLAREMRSAARRG